MDAKSKKQLLLIAGLVPVLIFILFRNIVGPQINKSLSARLATVSQSPSLVVPSPRQEDVMSLGDRSELIEQYREKPWKENPFFQKGIKRDLPQAPTQTPKSLPIPKFELEGIIMDESEPYAIINGELRQLGDWVGPFEIIEISDEKVILQRGEDTVVLSLFADSY